MRILLKIAIGLVVFLATSCFAQVPVPLANPDLSLRISGTVFAVVHLPDGGSVIGGNFTSVNGVPRTHIARLRANNELDTDWAPVLNGIVRALVVDAEGNVIAGGAFTQVNGLVRNRLVRFPGAGSAVPDPTWIPSPNEAVYAIAIGGDGSVYAAGAFTAVGGQPRNRLAKIAAGGTGSVDPDWNPSADSSVRALAVDAHGGMYVGGDFQSINGVSRRGLAKLSTSGAGAVSLTWYVYPIGYAGPNGRTTSIAVDDDDRVYIGGQFIAIGGVYRNNIARVSGGATAVVDPAWNPGTVGAVYALSLAADGWIYAGGAFSGAGSLPRRRLARIRGDGMVDVGWDPSVDGEVFALAAGGGRISVGGRFTGVGDSVVAGFATLNDQGTADGLAQVEMVGWPSSGGVISRMLVQPDGHVLVAGSFSSIGGVIRRHLARIDPSGNLDLEWNPSPDGDVGAMAFDSSGRVIVGGDFTRIGGQVRSGIAKVIADGSGAVDPAWNPSVGGTVYAVAVDPQGSVYLGGTFSIVGGLLRSRLAKLSEDGVVDPVWNPSADNGVNAIVVDAHGDILIGGYFTTVGNKVRNSVAKLSSIGSGAVSAQWMASTNGTVNHLALGPDGAVYAGGSFTEVNGEPRKNLARLSGSTGLIDLAWNPSPNGSRVNAVVLDGDGNAYVGGNYTTIGGLVRRNLAKVSAAGLVDPYWDPSPDNDVHSIVSGAQGVVHVGGAFLQMGNTARIGIAALPGPPSISIAVTDAQGAALGAATYGQPLNVIATVGSGAAGFDVDGSVAFFDAGAGGSTTLCDTVHVTGAGESATVSCNISVGRPGVGNRLLKATYDGGSTNVPVASSGAALVISPAETTTHFENLADAVAGHPYHVAPAVTAHAPSLSVPGGTVVVEDLTDGLSCSFEAGGAAPAGCTLTPMSAGTHFLRATFAGGVNFLGSAAGTSLEVARSAPTVVIDAVQAIAFGQSVFVKATVTGGAVSVTGTVTVDDGSESCTYDVVANDGCVLVPSVHGLLQLVASYSGDATNAPASSSAPLEVVPHGIGGAVTGLGAGDEITLRLEAGNQKGDIVAGNGTFVFAFHVPYGTGYRVTVLKSPAGLSCGVSNGVGQMPSSDVVDIGVSCGDRVFSDDFDG